MRVTEGHAILKTKKWFTNNMTTIGPDKPIVVTTKSATVKREFSPRIEPEPISTYHRETVEQRWKRVEAGKSEVFNESMDVDEMIESLKAYLAGTNTKAVTDQALITQVKSFLSSVENGRSWGSIVMG